MKSSFIHEGTRNLISRIFALSKYIVGLGRSRTGLNIMGSPLAYLPTDIAHRFDAQAPLWRWGAKRRIVDKKGHKSVDKPQQQCM
ncbi:MAG: hypothetical protein R8M38_03090 [Mariprofundaceae bacterium]